MVVAAACAHKPSRAPGLRSTHRRTPGTARARPHAPTFRTRDGPHGPGAAGTTDDATRVESRQSGPVESAYPHATTAHTDSRASTPLTRVDASHVTKRRVWISTARSRHDAMIHVNTLNEGLICASRGAEAPVARLLSAPNLAPSPPFRHWSAEPISSSSSHACRAWQRQSQARSRSSPAGQSASRGPAARCQ